MICSLYNRIVCSSHCDWNVRPSKRRHQELVYDWAYREAPLEAFLVKAEYKPESVMKFTKHRFSDNTCLHH